MTRFNDIEYNREKQELEVGAGCLWDEVYKNKDLRGAGRNVVGGSAIAGVGVAGFLLGGGYSLKTNQYGLGIDNVVKVRFTLPDGRTSLEVAEDNDPQLFYALRVRDFRQVPLQIEYSLRFRVVETILVSSPNLPSKHTIKLSSFM